MSEIIIPKFHCHRLGEIMAEPKAKADKEAGMLGQTAKGYVRSVLLREKYKYKEPLYTDPIMKGLLCEQEGIALVCRNYYDSKLCLKNKQVFMDELIAGTPDLLFPNGEYVDDVKVCLDLATFMECSPSKNNEYQLRGYMRLTGRKKARVIFCLVETPEQMVRSEISSYFYKFGCDTENADYLECERQILHNNSCINQIPIEKRTRSFEFEFDEKIDNNITEKVIKAQNYYKEIYETI